MVVIYIYVYVYIWQAHLQKGWNDNSVGQGPGLMIPVKAVSLL